jgi:hypothetical protein
MPAFEVAGLVLLILALLTIAAWWWVIRGQRQRWL